MPDTFGARLRHRREEQRIALGTIAEQTKIKASLLEALERDDVSQWPCGIFRRAFIRAYAHAIGLNPDVVVREFLEVHPEPGEVIDQIAATAAEMSRSSGGAPTRLRHIVGSALGSLSRLRRGAAPDDQAVPARAPTERGLGEPPADAFASDRSDEPAAPVDRPPVPAHSAADIHAALIPEPPTSAERALPEFELQAPPAYPVGSDDADEAIDAATERDAPRAPVAPRTDFLALARICTELACVESSDAVPALLQQAATAMDAIGMIVWLWDPVPEELRPAIAIGYSERVLAQLPPVKRDADNATAAAFRASRTCVIGGTEHTSGALAVPLLIPSGCAGVLAMELPDGTEQVKSVHAAAMFVAAQLAQLVGRADAAEARPAAERLAR